MIAVLKEDYQYNQYMIRSLTINNSIKINTSEMLSKEDFLKQYSDDEREQYFSFGWDENKIIVSMSNRKKKDPFKPIDWEYFREFDGLVKKIWMVKNNE